ncbi:hypothetical protein A1O7_03214 [Cladophialophora yegresii CBS 114405]|uniref:Uncharacterized protein n=1 Tax=Cladophialophora yegresii CBS 114405 TaxID=1182544 RepID=W9WCP2_9EURO|nr:uncharacterized protein A1O7_03214 [Cladophialophora yegresii CBS 114405]EXJ62775.1 hypothetical protein A1O7_03214 [Cladophialophora yegresii CBS 114405]
MSSDSKPTTALPTGASHRRSSSGISEDAARSAHEFMSGTIRRSSSGVTDDAATAAREFMRSSKDSGPGLNDDLADKMHKFMQGPATHRESHSKHLPDVTVSAYLSFSVLIGKVWVLAHFMLTFMLLRELGIFRGMDE